MDQHDNGSGAAEVGHDASLDICSPDDPTDGGLSPTPAQVAPHFDPPPHGYAAIRAYYGDITVQNGQVTAPHGWESANLSKFSHPALQKPLYCHKKIQAPLSALLDVCRSHGYAILTCGAFAPRAKRTSSSLSIHSWAAAVDINAASNPMRRPMQTDMPTAMVTEIKALGWTWGGDFPTPDPMHFQWCSGA